MQLVNVAWKFMIQDFDLCNSMYILILGFCRICTYLLNIDYVLNTVLFCLQSIPGSKMLKRLLMFLLEMLSSRGLSSFQWWTDLREKPWGLVDYFYVPFMFWVIFSFDNQFDWHAAETGYCWFLIHWRSWRHQRDV